MTWISPNVTQNPCTFRQSDFTEQQPALYKVVFGSVGLTWIGPPRGQMSDFEQCCNLLHLI